MHSVVVSVFLVFIGFASTATQTDWSDGGSVQGPVSDWNDAFWSSDASIDFGGGKLQLSSSLIPPIEHIVDGDFAHAHSVYSIDIDGDGDADVLGASYFDDDITWWENSDTSPRIIYSRCR